MAHGLVGVAACYVIYSFFASAKPRNQQMRRIAELLFVIYVVIAVWSLAESPTDKEAFLKLVPGGMPVYYTYVLLYCVTAMCYLPGYFFYDVTQVFVVLLLLKVGFVDCNVNYWTKKRGMDFWNQIRIILDGVCIILGLLMYMTCIKKKLYGTEETNDDAKSKSE